MIGIERKQIKGKDGNRRPMLSAQPYYRYNKPRSDGRREVEQLGPDNKPLFEYLENWKDYFKLPLVGDQFYLNEQYADFVERVGADYDLGGGYPNEHRDADKEEYIEKRWKNFQSELEEFNEFCEHFLARFPDAPIESVQHWWVFRICDGEELSSEEENSDDPLHYDDKLSDDESSADEKPVRQ